MSFKHKKQMLHACVATPAYNGMVHADYSQSMAEASWCAAVYGIRMTASVVGNGSFIELARNVFVKRFLEEFTDCTHLFFIDSDLRFSPNAFIGLLQANKPICAGVYRRRQDPEDYPCVWADHPSLGGLWFEEDWLQCKRVPTGFLCIRRDVLEEMAKDAPKVNLPDHKTPVPWLFHTKFDEKGRFVGEDYAFCDDYVERYKKMIPVWSNLEFTHDGYKGNFYEWIDKKVNEEKASQQTSSAA